MKTIGLAILAVIVLCVAGFVWSFFGTHDSLSTQNVAQKFFLTSKAPYDILWGTGSAYALMRGEINGTAKVEVIGNNQRDRTEFVVGPGVVEIAHGGPEEWVGDYSIHYSPLTATSGNIYASVYCGDAMSESDRNLYYDILRRK